MPFEMAPQNEKDERRSYEGEGVEPVGNVQAHAEGEERRRLAFPQPVRTPEELRLALVALAKEARAKGPGAERAQA